MTWRRVRQVHAEANLKPLTPGGFTPPEPPVRYLKPVMECIQVCRCLGLVLNDCRNERVR